MNKISSLILVSAIGAVFTIAAQADPAGSNVSAGNAGSNAGSTAGTSLGDSPSAGVAPAHPGASANGVGSTDSSTGVTRSSGAGIIDGTTRQPTGTPSYGAGQPSSGTASGAASSASGTTVPSGNGSTTNAPAVPAAK